MLLIYDYLAPTLKKLLGPGIRRMAINARVEVPEAIATKSSKYKQECKINKALPKLNSITFLPHKLCKLTDIFTFIMHGIICTSAVLIP